MSQLTYKQAQSNGALTAQSSHITGVPSFGYLYGYEDGNQHGVLPNGILVAQSSVTGLGNVWRAYDARTGQLTGFNLTNVPSGSAASATLAANSATGASAAGPNGEYLIYQLFNYGTTTTPKYYSSTLELIKIH